MTDSQAPTVVYLPDASSATDDELALLGMRLWPHTFAKTEDIVSARRHLFGTFIKAGMPLHQVETASIAGLTAAQWAHYGYPSLMAGHKYAAALMSTRAHVDSMEDIHVPWLAFRCIVPDGLLHIDGKPIDRIMISRRVVPTSMIVPTPGKKTHDDDDPPVVWVMELYPHSNDAARLHVYNASLHALLTADADSDNSLSIGDHGREPLGPDLKDAAARILVLAQRYVLGLLIMLQAHPKFGGATDRPVAPTSKRRDGPPNHRTFLLGGPIDVDCRPAVRDYVEGRRHGAPSVQHLVRGHYTHQVCGVGRTGRKHIWIKPYWRGPIEAPILVHTYRVGHEPEAP